MKYYELYPEVAGSIHEDCIIDVSTRPIKISFMHYEFDGWLGDDLLTEAGYFIVTEKLGNALKEMKLTGFNLEEAKISSSEAFREMYPNRKLPVFKWLVINGKSQLDDFYFSLENMMLHVSEDALSTLKQFNIENCDIEEI